MSPTVQIILLWIAFGASHVLLSSPRVRSRIAGVLGEGPFLGVYSLVALLFFVPLVTIYLDHRHEGGWLWIVSMTPVTTWAVYALVTIGVLLLIAGLLLPSPTSMVARGDPPEVRGIHRITRHPVIMGIGWIGLAHLIPNAAATDVAFFAGLPIFALIGCRHQERRMRATRGPEFAAYLEATPFLPFSRAGALRGLSELPLWIWPLGVTVSAVLRWLHPSA